MDKKEVLDFFRDLIVIVVIVLIIRTFFVMPFQISGSSMYSSYYDKGFIIVDRLSYRIGEIDRGDVVVFRPNVGKDKEYFLKRVIGLPGDNIKIENGNVYVKTDNDKEYKELDEKYLNEQNNGFTFVGRSKNTYEYSLGEDQYFVLGDNRNNSTDSRECFSKCNLEGKTNFIPKKDIIGKVLLDLGYFNFREFEFKHPVLGIDTSPKFFSSDSTYSY